MNSISYPKLSVLLPVYNGEKFLREVVESILNQSFPDFELIAIDDGSSDGTWGILHGFALEDSRIRLLRNDENLGLSETLDRGFKECRGEYFIRHDSDDVSVPHRFERQIEFLNKNPKIGAVGSMTEYIDADGHFLGKQHQAWSCEEVRAHLLMINCFCTTSVMIRKNLIPKAGGLTSVSKWAEDYEFFDRLSQITSMTVLPEVLVHYRLWENYFTKIHRREQMEDAFQISLRAVRCRLGNPNFTEAAYRRFWYAYFEQEGLIEDEKTYLKPGDIHKLRSFFELIRSDISLKKVWGHLLPLETPAHQHDSERPRVYHLASDYPVASWGTALIYQWVRLARRNGFEAFILHARRPFKIPWLNIEDIPICYADDPDFILRPDDILIVPEILIEEELVLQARCRKVVHIQNVFFISLSGEEPPDYAGLGYEAVLSTLPHVEEVVQKYYAGIPVYDIPPHVAPYFYLYPEDVKNIKRKKQILLYPKKDSLDYDTFKKMLRRALSKINSTPRDC